MNVLAMLDAQRVIGAAADSRGLRPCSYRFDPGAEGRHIRWAHDGSACVMLASVQRPDEDVVLDMVDGVLAANNRTDDWPLRRELLFTLMEAEILGD